MARDGGQTLRSLKQKQKAKPSKKHAAPKQEPVAAPKPLIRGKPFTFKSAKRRISAMDVDLGRLRERREMLESEDEAEDDPTHSLFGHALANSAELNLSLPFVKFYRATEPLSRSLPLVVHHKERIVRQICQALTAPRNEIDLAGETILDLIPPLVTDLSQLLLPQISDLLTVLVSLTAPSPLIADNPRIIERVYDVLGAIFRDLARDILSATDNEALRQVWSIVRRGLGGPAEQKPLQGDVAMLDASAPIDESDEDAAGEEVDQPIASTSTAEVFTPSFPPGFRTTPSTRRLLASAFAYLVRKARTTSDTSQLRRLLDLIISDLCAAVDADKDPHGKRKVQEEGSLRVLSEGVIWLVVESCLLDDGHAHSRASAIFQNFIDSALASTSDVQTGYISQIVESVVIAILMKVSDAKDASALLDIMLKALEQGATDARTVTITSQAISSALAIKEGQRFNTTQRAQLLKTIKTLVSGDALFAQTSSRQALLELTALVVSRSSITEFYSAKGEQIFDAICSPTDERLQFAVALVELLRQQSWPLLAHIALTRFFTLSREVLENAADSRASLCAACLSSLAQDERFKEGRQAPSFAPLESSMTKWCAKTMQSVSMLCIARRICADKPAQPRKSLSDTHAALRIAPKLSTFGDALAEEVLQLIQALLENESPADDAFATARLLSAALSGLKEAPTPIKTRLSTLTPSILTTFGWHRSVAASFVQLGLRVKRESRDQVQDVLLQNMLSEDSLVRLTALRCLDSILDQGHDATSDMLAKCIAIEEMPATVQGAREKAMAIRKVGITADAQLGRTITTGVDDYLAILTRFLIAMCKVNLRPLWSEAVAALALLSQRFAAQVWAVVLPQLLLAARHDPAILPRRPSQADAIKDVDAKEPVTQEADLTSWHAEQWRLTVANVTNDFENEQIVSRDVLKAEHSDGRLVIQTFEAQLLAFCTAVPDLAQKHSRDFVEVFLSCFHRRPDRLRDAEGQPLPSFVSEDESSKERKGRLLAWLGLFAKFTNPKALHHSADLHEYFLELVAFPDADVQKLALDCILRWKTPGLTANAAHLKNMLEPSMLRDELLRFVSSQEGDSAGSEHRSDMIPIVIRIAFGIMTSKAGRSSAGSGQGRAGRRAAILGALRTVSQEQLSLLVDLALTPFEEYHSSGNFAFAPAPITISPRRQVGFLGLLADLLKHLGEQLLPRWPSLLSVVLNILHFAQRGIESEKMEEAANEEADIDEDATHVPRRHIRQLGLKRFVDFSRFDVDFDLEPYVAAAFGSFISPRLAVLPAENAQAPSALMELFAVWSHRSSMQPWLVRFDDRLLPAVYACLTVRNVKPSVQVKVFEIAQALFDEADRTGAKESDTWHAIVQPTLPALLQEMTASMDAQQKAFDVKTDVAARQVTLLCSIAPYVEESESATKFVQLLVPLLRRPNKSVPEKTKVDLLKIMSTLLPHVRFNAADVLYRRCFEALGMLFVSNRTRNGRIQNAEAFNAFTSGFTSLQRVGRLAVELNSYSTKRSEEPDFDRRLDAFRLINEIDHEKFSADEWTMLLQNMLFFVQDPEELAIRTNASYAMRRFVEQAAKTDTDLTQVLTKTLLPGLRNVLHSKLETVRSEVLGVYAFVVEQVSSIDEIRQLKCLLVGGDDEANFFNNIGHIQMHRRTRAMRRLADEIEAGNVKGKVVPDLLLPLLDHFILDADTKRDAEVINEAIQAVGRIARHLSWSPYNHTVQQYSRLAKRDGPVQRASMRALVACLKSYHFDLSVDEKVLVATTTKLLPQLLAALEDREGIELEKRIPLAEGIAAVTLQVPTEERQSHVADLVTSLAQFLREKDQNVRDSIRVTLANICITSKGSLLAPLVGEMRRALQRGPQMHILAYSLHAILVKLAESLDQLDLTDALEVIVSILVEDCLGAPAVDRTSEEFRAKSKFREVKSFKSMDSFQIVAEHVEPAQVSLLLAPLRDSLRQTDSNKTLRDVDEVLRRISIGLVANKKLSGVDLLDLCHSLISQSASFMSAATARKKRRAKDSLIQDIKEEQDFFAANAHRFVSFGLELFNAGFRKSRYALDDGVVLGRLDALVSVVGNTLYSDDPNVLARGMRALAHLIRCPLRNVDQASPVLVKQMLAVVERSGSTESELVQSALRTLATVIRDCRSATLREEQLRSLLELVGPDLEETDRQATLFQVLRAIMSRKFVAPEIYDLMEKVATMLVTNQSSNVREVCRAIYLQFLLDYPQGKGRLKNSLAFLAKNLSFAHESGRLSVLELLSAVFSKFAPSLLDDSADLFFVSLVMVLANDESSRCREMAIELLKILVSKVDDKRRDSQINMLGSWASGPQPVLARTALQVFSAFIETGGNEQQRQATAEAVRPILAKILAASQERLAEAEDEGLESLDEDDWQLSYHALQTTTHVFRFFATIISADTEANWPIWHAVTGHLLYPHEWVRTSSSRLLGSLYASSGTSVADATNDSHPLSSASLLDMAKKSCLQLKSRVLGDALAMQIVKNLYFAVQIFDSRRPAQSADQASDDGNDEESESDDEGEHETHEASGDPMRWLMSRLSFQARQAHTHRPSLHAKSEGKWSLQPMSILRLFAAIISYASSDRLEPFVGHIASPIFRIVEDPNTQDPQMGELQGLANEVQTRLADKIGTTKFANVYNELRQRQLEKRRKRKADAAVAAITEPEKEAQRKAKRAEQKARQKKRKNAANAERKAIFGQTEKKIKRRKI